MSVTTDNTLNIQPIGPVGEGKVLAHGSAQAIPNGTGGTVFINHRIPGRFGPRYSWVLKGLGADCAVLTTSPTVGSILLTHRPFAFANHIRTTQANFANATVIGEAGLAGADATAWRDVGPFLHIDNDDGNNRILIRFRVANVGTDSTWTFWVALEGTPLRAPGTL